MSDQDTRSHRTQPEQETPDDHDGRRVRKVFAWVEPSYGRYMLALALVAMIAWVRAPYTQIPDALFVSDGFGYYIYLPSIFIDHDLDLSNQITRIPYEGQKRFYSVSPETGSPTNQFPIGSAILWSPFFLAADVAACLLQALGMDIARDGFGYVYELPVYLGSAAFGLAAVGLTLRNLRLMFPRSISLASLFGIVFATPLAYYCVVEPNMSHTVAMFAISLWLWQLHLIYKSHDARWSTWITLGLSLGVVALVRPYNGLLGLVAIPIALSATGSFFAADVTRIQRLSQALGRLIACCLSAFLVLTVQMVVWKILYGQWFVVPKGSGYEKMSWLNPPMSGYLSSVLLYSPLYGLGFLGLILGGRLTWRDGPQATSLAASEASHQTEPGPRFARLVAPWMVVVLILISLVVAASRDWYLGTAFGQRRLVDWSVFFAFGVALLLSSLQRHAAVAKLVEWCVFGLAIVQTGLASVYLARPGWLPEYGRLF